MRVLEAREADVELYSPVTGCPLQCSGIKNAPAEGYSPCGFFASAERSTIVFLVVGADPGPQLEGNPAGGTAEERAREFLEKPRFLSPAKRRTLFHEGVLAALREVFGECEDRALFRRVVYTNVVKCSPVGKVAPSETRMICYARHLAREIQYFEPWAIVAVGSSKELFRRIPLYAPWARRSLGFP